MNNFFRALIAGAAAKKFGGGCLGTILVFVLVWVALGQCGSKPIAPETPKRAKEGKESHAGSLHTPSHYFLSAAA